MKKIIIFLFVVFSFESCSLLGSIIDTTTYGLLKNVKLYAFAEYDLTGIDTFGEIANFINNHMYWKEDFLEEFSTPENTMERGFGDCEDFCFVFSNLAYLTMGIKMHMVIMNIDEWYRTVEEGGIGNHVVLEYDGGFYSGQYGYEVSVSHVLYSFTFDEVFY